MPRFCRLFKAAGADLIDCSSGQVGRKKSRSMAACSRRPFSDKIRNEIHIPTIAVGAISEADHANSIIAAGRADLCAVARPHLADPSSSCTRRQGSVTRGSPGRNNTTPPGRNTSTTSPARQRRRASHE
jgi:2,4-dienoyl-CoA reductase-like NADH-dependent reductase (Old Yellow Enzyme family)